MVAAFESSDRGPAHSFICAAVTGVGGVGYGGGAAVDAHLFVRGRARRRALAVGGAVDDASRSRALRGSLNHTGLVSRPYEYELVGHQPRNSGLDLKKGGGRRLLMRTFTSMRNISEGRAATRLAATARSMRATRSSKSPRTSGVRGLAGSPTSTTRAVTESGRVRNARSTAAGVPVKACASSYTASTARAAHAPAPAPARGRLARWRRCTTRRKPSRERPPPSTSRSARARSPSPPSSSTSASRPSRARRSCAATSSSSSPSCSSPSPPASSPPSPPKCSASR
mmetsp:Transcript_14734/g.48327  ORF Transcript_14734/g.48327 Transcript_14734/m.48327 type:complete len:284 (-) Transcript_14734:539-1390(-)